MGSYDVAIVISAATFLTLRLPKRNILGDTKDDVSTSATGTARK
jgi:hypothetical protein